MAIAASTVAGTSDFSEAKKAPCKYHKKATLTTKQYSNNADGLLDLFSVLQQPVPTPLLRNPQLQWLGGKIYSVLNFIQMHVWVSVSEPPYNRCSHVCPTLLVA